MHNEDKANFNENLRIYSLESVAHLYMRKSTGQKGKTTRNKNKIIKLPILSITPSRLTMGSQFSYPSYSFSWSPHEWH